MRNIRDYTIMDRQGTVTDTFTAATTDICTAAAHAYKNGDMVVLSSTTTLPAGLATSTVYYVIEAATNTFKFSATPITNYTTGLITPPLAVDITDTGTGTHTMTMHDIGNSIYCEEFRHAVFSFDGDNSANMTVKFQGSVGDSTTSPYSCPDFSAAQAYTNSWDYIEVIDLEDGAAIDGDTGIAQAGTADHRILEANVNGLSYINCIVTAWSAGDTTIRVRLFNN